MRIGYDAKRIFHNATGLGNYSRDLIRILSSFYPQDSYFLYNPNRGKFKCSFESNLNIEIKYPNLYLWKKLSSIWRLGPVVDQIKKDGVKIFHGLSNEVPVGLKKAGIKSVVTIHDLIWIRYPKLYNFIDRKIYYRKIKYALRNTDYVIAISEQTKNDIVDFFNVSKEKIKVIYQGCSDVFKKELKDNQLEKTRIKYRLPDEFLLYVGTVERRKNLITIIKSVKKTGKNLVVVGRKTNYMDCILSYVREHKLENKVYFYSSISFLELPAFYQMASIFIYPSICEGFGIPIIEALYSKTPVITSNVSSLPEAAGPYSLLIDPKDVTQMSDAIEKLWNHSDKRKSVIEKSYQFVQKFNDNIVAQELHNLYRLLKI